MRAAGVGLLLAVAGCVIPTGPHFREDLHCRRNVEAVRGGAFPEPGMTREHVLLCLGAPDVCDDQERRFTYTWSKATSVIAVWGGASTLTRRDYALEIRFGPAGRVESVARRP